MKRISMIVVAVLTLALLVYANSRMPQSGAIKKVEVTAGTIASLPAGEAYVIDLTRKETRTIYSLAAGIDRRRVLVITPTDKMPLNDLVNKLGTSGKLLVGTLGDIQKLDPLLVGGTSQIHDYDCSGVAICTCDHAGCTVLELEGKCLKEGWFCDDKGNCVCIKK